VHWRDAADGRSCDVMIDSGMNRLGLSAEQALSGLLDGLTVETAMSHLACADEPGHPLNEEQLDRFRSLRRAIAARRYSLANSAGICLGGDYAFDLTRPGLALYGGVPVIGDARQEAALRQVAHVEAQLVQIRDVPGGATVGYGATWTAPSDRKIGILNIGYADGYLRALGRTGRARAAEAVVPVVGRVSMDLLAVDLTGVGAAEGDWLEIDYRLPRLAHESGISQYELLTTLGRRHERIWS
jgi:alanine racemase